MISAEEFRVYLVTDRAQAPGGDMLRVVQAALDGGVRAVQLREKDLSGKELFRLAERMRELTARYSAKLLVNDRADVARCAGADGVHLGVSSIPAAEARRMLGPGAVIGCSTHGAREIREATEGGADFVVFGPVYATPSKAAYGPPAGVAALAEACRSARIPVLAVGGVGPERAGEAIGAGAAGVALISGIVAAADPRCAAESLVASVKRALAAA